MEGGEGAADAEHKEAEDDKDGEDEIVVAAEGKAVEVWPDVEDTDAEDVGGGVNDRRE